MRHGISFMRPGVHGMRMKETSVSFTVCQSLSGCFADIFPRFIIWRFWKSGGGLGEMYDNLAASFKGETFHYTVTEYSENAVKVLQKKYAGNPSVTIVKADAQNLIFEDKSFDIVLAFDVMHHVKNPLKMAQELMRVSRNHVFMCEACGWSLVRKTVEKTRACREKGERSYTPARMRGFFRGCSFVEIVPFYFFVPPKVKKKFMWPFIAVSEIGQRIPGLRWQSQSMSVYVRLK